MKIKYLYFALSALFVCSCAGDNKEKPTNAEKYQKYCEKYGDTDLNMYMSSPSDAVVNDFRSIHVYSNEKCIDDELIVKFSSCKEFIKSHYTNSRRSRTRWRVSSRRQFCICFL